MNPSSTPIRSMNSIINEVDNVALKSSLNALQHRYMKLQHDNTLKLQEITELQHEYNIEIQELQRDRNVLMNDRNNIQRDYEAALKALEFEYSQLNSINN